jgi:pilus assembly protein CpaB
LSRRTGVLLAIVGVVLLGLGCVFVYGLLRSTLTPAPAPTPVPPPTVTVLVTTRDIPDGVVIQAGDVTQVEVPVELAPSGAIASADQVVGKFSKVALVQGEMVMQHNLADPTNVQRDLAFELSDDMVLMAFPINELMGQLNMLKRGDLVDVLVSIEMEVQPQESGPLTAAETPEPETILFTFDALQRVTISGVVVEVTSDQFNENRTQQELQAATNAEGTPIPTPMPPPSQVTSQALLLALNPQDALILKNLKDDGGVFDIVVRAPTSEQLFELDPVMMEYLIDRYELEVTR